MFFRSIYALFGCWTDSWVWNIPSVRAPIDIIVTPERGDGLSRPVPEQKPSSYG